MIKKFAIALLIGGIAALTPNADATPLSFVGNGYAILDVNGGGNVFYNLNNSSDTVNPKYDTDNTSNTAFSQTFTIQLGQSIKLGGELQTFPSQPGTSAFLGYRITDLSETTGSFAELNLPFLDNVGSNDRWQQLATPGGVEVGSSLAAGTYLLELYQHGSNGPDNLYNQEGAPGNNWEARVEVVPEPATWLVGAMTLGGCVYLRRRRKA
jgi:hypothetical protein